MHFWIGVENFAKIESAKICVNNYTLLVGPNNCGKTFLMQLVQGLGKKIIEFIDNDMIEILLEERIESYSKYLIDENNISKIVAYLNEKLALRKEQIIKDIFVKDISIERLYIDIELDKNSSYQIESTNKKSVQYMSEESRKEFGDLDKIFSDDKDEFRISVLSKVEKTSEQTHGIMFSISDSKMEISTLKSVLNYLFQQNSLFFPASRTGLILLYRDFFANKTDNAISFQIEGNELVENRERYGGLTQPMYEFLRFLQTYLEWEDSYKEYKNELEFFENRLIEGHISINKQGKFAYNSNTDDTMVPIYLASAMINEVAPIAFALTSGRRYERFIIDEVEASLHPEKQLEMVRFLNRLSNKGMQLILSTHSDTFVSKLNNLYILSEYFNKNQDESILDKFDLEKEDLIQKKKLFVYEFINQENGKSIVKEICPNEKTGYQFDLFTKSALNLYEEALQLGEFTK